MRNTNRLGCLSGVGISAAIIMSLVIASLYFSRGGLMFSPGPLNAQSGEPLGGVTSHAGTGGDCEACHTAPWEPAKMEDRCAECHGEITVQMKNAASMHGKMMHDNPDLGCRHCHPDHRGADAKLTEIGDAKFPHEVVGFALNGHQTTGKGDAFVCSDCHGDDITMFDLQVCDTCHRQMDLGFMTAHTLSFGTACLDCHDGMDSLVTGFNHNEYQFKLTGKHEGLLCVQCHTDARSLENFEQTSQECYSCHRNDEPHEGRYGLNCEDCHSTDGWSPAKFDHNLSVFKLEGKHAEVACEDCHQNGEYIGTPTDCFSCHKQEDEHGSLYGTDCSICHNPSSWEDASFNHQDFFPLTGAHSNLTCQQCHKNNQFEDTPNTCAACHGDPAFHAGLFGWNCTSCHTVNNWSAVYRGPHPKISNEGGSGVNHGGASCNDCHTKSLHTATCSKCHNGNPEDGGGGDD